MTNSKNFPTGAHTGLIVVEWKGSWIQLVPVATVNDTGVWTWSGFYPGATARPIEVGDVFTKLFISSDVGTITATVVKVNRKTIKVADDNGTEYTIAIA